MRRTLKIAERELRDYLTRTDKSYDGKKGRGDLAWGIIWQQMGRCGRFELRQKWLVKAGWDTGWLLKNWNELPRQLKLDLVNNEPKPEEDFKP